MSLSINADQAADTEVQTVRAVNAVSSQEMQRRWRALRISMKERGIDALVVQNSSDWVGGYIRYLTNRPANNGYFSSVVFPIEGGSSLIEQGPFDGSREAAAEEAALSGLARILSTPSYPSVGYTGSYDAAIAVRELARMGARRVGMVAPASMYHTFAKSLIDLLSGIDIVDATDWVDRIKALKSVEERELIRQVAAMQDQVMAGVRDYIGPGKRDFEVAAHAQYLGQQLGSEQGIFLCSSAPQGMAATFKPRSMQGRTIQHGDVFSLLIENNGAGGFYTELSRTFVLGRASSEMRETYDAVLDAQRFALTLLVPGADCREIYHRHNDYLEKNRLPAERRLSIHGMGYDMVERPLVRSDEEMSIAADMSIVCHPGFANQRMFIHNTDNYLIDSHGASECIHRTPKQIFEL